MNPFAKTTISSFLRSDDGRKYLSEKYCQNGWSTYQVAEDLGTYANNIVRALKYHGFILRNKTEAQSNAIKNERHPGDAAFNINGETNGQSNHDSSPIQGGGGGA